MSSLPAAVLPASLPDVATQPAALARPLDWVGMEGIALPLRVADGAGGHLHVPAQADLSVDLGQAGERGIHMSRLYMRLQQELARNEASIEGLRRILQGSIDSQGGLSTRARLRLRYEALLLRRALRSDNAGWKRYPVEIEALLDAGQLAVTMGFDLEYSSTCPCSAALSRQANAARFAADFADARPMSTAVVRDWLASERGMAATPHAQRSRARIRVALRPGQGDGLPLEALVDALETALGTPVQTAVKREDEQAFAELNAANLMFCEDAARRVASVLSGDPRIEHFQATVSHFESLHPHDAVATVSGRGPAA